LMLLWVTSVLNSFIFSPTTLESICMVFSLQA
jgi:hypothetical protein